MAIAKPRFINNILDLLLSATLYKLLSLLLMFTICVSPALSFSPTLATDAPIMVWRQSWPLLGASMERLSTSAITHSGFGYA